MSMAPVKVMIIDDSAVVRKSLSENLGLIKGIQVVGTAMDPLFAKQKIPNLNPDVLVLDIEMPRMDGLEFLKHLMETNPLPVIILSSLVKGKSQTYFKALELGALEVIAKPDSPNSESVSSQIALLSEKIIQAARVNRAAQRALARSLAAPARKETSGKKSHALWDTTDKIVVIGASTGGTQTIRSILTQLEAHCPPIFIVQHMPPIFTRSFAENLNQVCPMEVREAQEGDTMRNGLVLVAPGNFHAQIIRKGAKYLVALNQRPPVFHLRPAVDVLFHSVAVEAGANATGILLTGMGSDGARGLLAMKKAGAVTYIQDEQSCVVYGMPKAAFEIGACDTHTPLTRIPQKIMEVL